MTFERLQWKNGDPTTPLSAENLNRIEQAIVDLVDEIDELKATIENNKGSIAHLYDSMQGLSSRVAALVEEVSLLRTAQESAIQYNEETGELILK
jgi:archaellum component FlaC